MVLAREISVDENGAGDASTSYASVHSSLVAYVLALSGRGSNNAGGGVWLEHSYARASKHASKREPRTLLAPQEDTCENIIDVGREGEPVVDNLPPLPFDSVAEEEEEPACTEEVEEEWESRVAALAPSAAHARLAARAADILRELRLARLAAPAPASRLRRKDQARAAAYKLRRALAPTWAWTVSGGGAGSAGAAGGGGAAWLYSVLSAYLPRRMRALLEELLEELRRMAPRLSARLPAAATRAPPDPVTAPAPPAPSALTPHGPLLVWVSAGRIAADARWEKRLRGLVPTRVVGGGQLPPRAPPDQWCAAQAANAKAGLDDVLAEAGSRPIFLAGFEAGASLCCLLHAGLSSAGNADAVRGLALLAPPLETAEGDDTLDTRAPTLLITGSVSGHRVQALEACLGAGAAGGSRRLVLVGGADRALRVNALQKAPQVAVDAAILEEVVRWAHELADAEDDTDSASNNEYSGDVIDIEDDDEYSHLPPPAPPAAPAAPPAPTPAPPPSPAATSTTMGTPPGPGMRAIEIVEGRVVSRVSGSTPLLLTPRRAPPAPRAAPPAPPAPADILQMPIVFADDDPPPIQAPSSAEPTESRVTVTSGNGRGSRPLKYTRVIVAKRGAHGGAPRLPLPPARPAPRPAAPRPGHVLVRRSVQIVKHRPRKEH